MSWHPLTYQHGLVTLANRYAILYEDEDLSKQTQTTKTKENESVSDNARLLHVQSSPLNTSQALSFSTPSPLSTGKERNEKHLYNQSLLERQLKAKQEIEQLDSNEMNNQLLKSSEEGDCKTVRHLLHRKFKAKINPNIRDDLGETPLHKAAKKGHSECMKFLLLNNANVYAEAKNGYTPMTFAIQSGKTAVIRFLVEAKYDINYSKRPPLLDACRNFVTNRCACTKSSKEFFDSVAMAQYLLRCNASILKTPNVIFKLYKKGHTKVMVPCRKAIKILLLAGFDAKVLQKLVSDQADFICRNHLMDPTIWGYFDVQLELAKAVASRKN